MFNKITLLYSLITIKSKYLHFFVTKFYKSERCSAACHKSFTTGKMAARGGRTLPTQCTYRSYACVSQV